MLKGIIFDFDGVIAESVQVKTDAFARLYNQYGNDIVKKVIEHHEANGGMSRYEKFKIYHKSFLNKTISEEKITDLAEQFSKLVIDKVIKAPYVPGVLEYINSIYKKYKLFISTGTPNDEINHIVEKKYIIKYFTEIYGSPDKKENHINHIIKNYGFKVSDLVYIGDSETDYKAALKMDVKFILRENESNYEYFKDYKRLKIKDFVLLDIEKLLRSNDEIR